MPVESLTSPAIMSVVVAMLLLQGGALLRQRQHSPHFPWLGFLALAAAAMALASAKFIRLGEIVLGLDVGVSLFQGTTAWVAWCSWLVGAALWGGLLVHTARAARKRNSWIGRLLLMALIIAIVAAAQVQPLDQSADPTSIVRAYDIWWPGLVLWLIFCHSECALTLCGAHDLSLRLLVDTGLMIVVSTYAIQREESRMVYAGALQPSWTHCRWLVVTVFAAALGVSVIKRLTRPLRGHPALDVRAMMRSGPARLASIAASVTVILVSLSDLLGWHALSPMVDLLAIVLAVVVLVEASTAAPLGALRDLLAALASPESRFRVAISLVSQWLAQHSTIAGDGPADGQKKSVPRLISLTLLGVLVLVVVSELPNAGTTVVHPFQTIGLDESEKYLGEALSARLVNTLGLLDKELRPELLIITADSEIKNAGSRVVAASDPKIDARAATVGTDPAIGGVVIPVGALTAMLHRPLRLLLGVRTIEGSIQKVEGRYVLLANSSSGETWRFVDGPPADAATANTSATPTSTSPPPGRSSQVPSPAHRAEDAETPSPASSGPGTLQGAASVVGSLVPSAAPSAGAAPKRGPSLPPAAAPETRRLPLAAVREEFAADRALRLADQLAYSLMGAAGKGTLMPEARGAVEPFRAGSRR